MPARDLPARPNLAQYKKQAKDLLDRVHAGDGEALRRFSAYRTSPPAQARLTEAQFVIAREHGFDSWPAFSAHVSALEIGHAIASLIDPPRAFLEAAVVPRDHHGSGDLARAEAIRARYPDVAHHSIHAAAVLGDADGVRAWLARDAALATATGGPHGWDALTHLCFSRYLRLDASRSSGFVAAARVLLDAGANARTGWYETIDHPNPRPVFESAIYGAAGIARHAALTQLLLERGADPNDEETPYHVPETRDLDVLRLLLASGTLNAESLTTLLLRKADWHDGEGVRLLLEHGADPNRIARWGYTALHQAVRRDNAIETIELLLAHGADPTIPDVHGGQSATALAAIRGRRAAIERFNLVKPAPLSDIEHLIAACALDDHAAIDTRLAHQPQLRAALIAHGGVLLANFAGTGNVAGVGNLLRCGISPAAIHQHGDGYFDIAKSSTALHVAAWRAWPDVVRLLIDAGTPVNAVDGKGRTALMLAVKACVDSFWTARRSPDSVKALLDAGASRDGIALPTGYAEIDRLLEG